jgi:hypothetical protein
LNRFAQAVREELWVCGRLVESRLAHGEALDDGESIVARDARDDALVEICEREIGRLRKAIPGGDFTVRLVAEANTDERRATMTVRRDGRSIVTTPESVQRDLPLLASEPSPGAGRMIVWRNGTGAVLLHEAAGHPLEHGKAQPELPPWLHVDIPLASRRATFRDVPMLRMTRVHVTQTGAPFALPEERIEVELIDSGAYDPVTDTVTIRVAVPSFDLVVPRSAILFLGATGDAIRYPGVICSREGQELVVDSYAPVLLTGFR